MHKFKVGDEVIITIPADRYSGPSFVEEMEAFFEDGKLKAHIVELEPGGGDEDDWYLLDIDYKQYLWSDLWMTKVNKFKGNK